MTPFNDLFEIRTYPTGETHVQFRGGHEDLRAIHGSVILFDQCFTFTDLCHAVTANRLLKRRDVDAEWFIPYFPFARDDRRESSRDGSCLELAMDLALTELNPVVFDPHSDVTARLRSIHQRVLLHHVLDHKFSKEQGERPVLVVPDLGATKKADKWCVPSYHKVQGLKHRNPDTGALSGFGVLNPEDVLDGASCLIVDDICDGGGTFIGLANELVKYGVNDVSLLVSHGLFTKGPDILFRVFDQIIMAGNPFSETNPRRVDIVDWADLYGKALIS